MNSTRLLKASVVSLLLFAASSLWGQRSVTLSVPGDILVGKGDVSVVLEASGEEAALGFSLVFDPAKLQFEGHAAGSAASGATIHVNQLKASSGRLGVAMMLPPGTALAKGAQQVLRLSFKVAAPGAGSTSLAFTNGPVDQEVASVDAKKLNAAFVNKTIKVQP